jgi:hypothetical protein
MVHASIIKELANVGLLPKETVAATHASYEKAESQRAAVLHAARNTDLPVADELRIMNEGRVPLLEFVTEELRRDDKQHYGR